MFVRSFTPIQRNVVSLRMVLDANIIIGTNASDRSDCDASVANGSRPRHRGQTSGSWGPQKPRLYLFDGIINWRATHRTGKTTGTNERPVAVVRAAASTSCAKSVAVFDKHTTD